MVKSSCIGAKIKNAGFSHVISIIDTGLVPGHIINGHPGTRQAVRNLILDFFKLDGGIIVNPASAFHSKKSINVG